MAKNSEFLTKIIVGGEISKTLAKALGTSEKLVKDTMKKVADAGKTVGKVANVMGAAVIAGAAYSVKAAMTYEQSLSKVATLADTSKKSIEQLSAEVMDISNKTGVAATEINEALYQAISAGADTAHATELVDVAVKSSIAGFTDAATAVDGLTTVINAYGMQTQDAQKIANQMLITQNLGKTTFGELSTTVGKLAPIFNSASLSSEEMFASLASLTANGIATSEAVSGMKAAISNVIKPTGDAQKMAKALGLDFSTTALQSKGLAGFLAEVKDKTNGNLDAMAMLFGSVEGLNAVLALTSDKGGALLNQTLQEMQTNTTAVSDAFNTMMTPEQKMAILQTKMQNVAITLGQKLLPYVEKATDWLNNVDIDKVISSIETFAPIILGIAAALKVMSVVIAIVNAVTMASPVTWIVLGIVAAVAALIAIIVLCVKHWDAIKAAGVAAWQWIKNAFSTAGTWFYNTVIAPIANFFSGLWQGLSNGAQSAWQWVCNAFSNVVGFFTGIWTTITGFFSKIGTAIGDAIGGAFKSVVNSIIGFAENTINGFIKAINLAIDLINAIPGVNIPKLNLLNIPRLATGGTFDGTHPQLAVVGDAAETIVPHGNTQRNRELLATAARGVGGGALGGNNVQITFAPVVYGAGGADIRQGINDAAADFEQRMDEFLRKKGLLSYA